MNTPLNDDQLHEIKSLDLALKLVDRARAAAAEQRGAYAANEPWPLFARKMRMLTPQSYGARFEAYFTNHFGWDKTHPSDARGDIVVTADDGTQTYHEVKVTLITGSNRTANFVQIRPHHDVDGYHLFVVDTTADYRVTHYKLTKDQMRAELDRIGSLAHGTKGARSANTGPIEHAIRLLWDSAAKERWDAAYSVPCPM